MYWVPLIALFTGARTAEILQLEKQDIKNDKKIDYFDINDNIAESEDQDKHVKKDGSRRTVPIHRQLIKPGFLDYVKSVDGRLFPDEPRNNKSGKFSNFGKRFATYKKQVGVVKEHRQQMKDFHSFRHTVQTRLTDIKSTGKASERFDEGIINAIIGHASDNRSIGEKTYNLNSSHKCITH